MTSNSQLARVGHITMVLKVRISIALDKAKIKRNFSHITGLCSLIDENLTTFDAVVLNTTELGKDHNCWTLLAADCSDQSRISVFTKPSGNGSFAIKVYVGDDTIEYHPYENEEQIMTVNSENKFKLHAMDSKEISLLSTLTPIQ